MNRLAIIILFIGVCAVGFTVLALRPTVESALPPGDFPLDVPALRETITSLIHTQGGTQTYADIKKTYADSSFDFQHTVAHVFGETLYEVERFQGVVSCDPTFAFGCYHGFFISASASEGLSIVKKMDDACGLVSEGDPSACRHGIGHGIMEYLGVDRLDEALETCLQTTQPDPAAGCTSGVFMEYNVPLSSNENGNFSTEARPLGSGPFELCARVQERFRHSCYHEMPQWLVQVYDRDYKTIGALCASLNEEYSKTCFSGMGNVLAPSAQFDPRITRSYCEQIVDARGAYLCRAAAAWSVALDGNGMDDAQKVCDISLPEYNAPCPQDSKK